MPFEMLGMHSKPNLAVSLLLFLFQVKTEFTDQFHKLSLILSNLLFYPQSIFPSKFPFQPVSARI